MSRPNYPLHLTVTVTPESVKSIFDLIADAAGTNPEYRKAARRVQVSRKAIFAGEEPPEGVELMITRQQAAEMLKISSRTIDNLKSCGRMPQPIRIGRAVRWNRAELVAWVDAGCPDCSDWKYEPAAVGV